MQLGVIVFQDLTEPGPCQVLVREPVVDPQASGIGPADPPLLVHALDREAHALEDFENGLAVWGHVLGPRDHQLDL